MYAFTAVGLALARWPGILNPPPGISHPSTVVAMFLGWKNGKRKMIHAPYGNKRVHRTTPWTSQWFAGTLR